jgi:hypothetical protein
VQFAEFTQLYLVDRASHIAERAEPNEVGSNVSKNAAVSAGVMPVDVCKAVK